MNALLPQWTKKVTTTTRGRDPLGLSRVIRLVNDFLLTGIITTTTRARYYSLFCWALFNILEDDPPKNYTDFVTSFQKRESLIALSTVAYKNNKSLDGVNATKIQYEQGKSSGNYNFAFRTLPSNRLGAYGQIYSGSMNSLGLLDRTNDCYDYITNGIAEELALLIQENIEDLYFIRDKQFNDNTITEQDLEIIKPFLSLDSLSESFAFEERKKLIELFFGLNNKANTLSISRRNTLVQILYLINEYEKLNTDITINNLDDKILYAPSYFSQLQTSNNILKYNHPVIFDECKSLWRQFTLQQFLTSTLESLFTIVLKLSTLRKPATSLDIIVKELLHDDFFKEYRRPKDLFASLGVLKVPDENKSMQFQNQYDLTNKLNELILFSECVSNKTNIKHSLMLLALIYIKWRGIIQDKGYLMVSTKANQELWTGNLVCRIDHWLDESVTWYDALISFIQEYILKQHDKIVLDKKTLESSYLRYENGLIIKEQDYEFHPRSSRHYNAISIMEDLELLEVNSDKVIKVTESGKNIINMVLKEHE